MIDLKCLSLLQPWATLVAIGAKRIETRSWSTNYRGPLAIAASKKWNRIDAEWVLHGTDKAAKAIRQALNAAGYQSLGELPLGAVLCVGSLANCIRFNDGWCPAEPESFFGNYATGRYGFVLDVVKALPEPIPVTGQRGLWVPDAPVLERFYGEAA